MTTRFYNTFILAVFLSTTILHAETDQSTANNQPSFSNSISQGIFNGMATDPNSVKENTQNRSSGREYKAADAQNQGNTGGAVATGTGAAMIATGIPMAASPIIPVMVAGFNLIAMGSLELAQGAADHASANKNGAQKDQLENNIDQRSVAPTTTPKIENAELDKLLGDSGVNAEDFKNRLANGEFQTGADILKALGKDISPEDIAAAQSITDQQSPSFFNGPTATGLNGTTNNGVLTSNESAGQGTASTDSTSSEGESGSEAIPSAGRSLASTSDGSPSATVDPSAKPTLFATGDLGAGSKKGFAKVEPQLEGAAGESTVGGLFDVNHLIQGVLGENASVQDKAMALTMVRQELGTMGIKMPVKGQNIFDTAHHNYGNFGRWRKNAKIAQR